MAPPKSFAQISKEMGKTWKGKSDPSILKDKLAKVKRSGSRKGSTESSTENSTEDSTQAKSSTENSTESSTEDSTQAKSSTESSTEDSTENSTEKISTESNNQYNIEGNTQISTEDNTEDNTESSTESSTENSTKNSTKNNTQDNTENNTENNTGNNTEDNIKDSTENNTQDDTESNIRYSEQVSQYLDLTEHYSFLTPRQKDMLTYILEKNVNGVISMKEAAKFLKFPYSSVRRHINVLVEEGIITKPKLFRNRSFRGIKFNLTKKTKEKLECHSGCQSGCHPECQPLIEEEEFLSINNSSSFQDLNPQLSFLFQKGLTEAKCQKWKKQFKMSDTYLSLQLEHAVFDLRDNNGLETRNILNVQAYIESIFKKENREYPRPANFKSDATKQKEAVERAIALKEKEVESLKLANARQFALDAELWFQKLSKDKQRRILGAAKNDRAKQVKINTAYRKEINQCPDTNRKP